MGVPRLPSWIVLSVVHGRVVIVCLSVLVSPFMTPSYTQPIQLQAHTPALARYTEKSSWFPFLRQWNKYRWLTGLLHGWVSRYRGDRGLHWLSGVNDAPLPFNLYPVPVSQCHLIGRNTFMLIDENYIEVSISISRNVPAVNTKLYGLVLTSLHQRTDVN